MTCRADPEKALNSAQPPIRRIPGSCGGDSVLLLLSFILCAQRELSSCWSSASFSGLDFGSVGLHQASIIPVAGHKSSNEACRRHWAPRCRELSLCGFKGLVRGVVRGATANLSRAEEIAWSTVDSRPWVEGHSERNCWQTSSPLHSFGAVSPSSAGLEDPPQLILRAAADPEIVGSRSLYRLENHGWRTHGARLQTL